MNCISCNQGLYLQNSLECVKVTVIENCSLYQSDISKSSCSKCEDPFYLVKEMVDGVEEFVCTERSNKEIENCEVFKNDQDECESCKKGFQIHFSKLSCFESIENCAEDNANPDDLKCTKCNNGFGLTVENRCDESTL